MSKVNSSRQNLTQVFRNRIDLGETIVVRLQGGLGNQLFILAAGLEQSKRLGCKLVVDSSLLKTGVRTLLGITTKRELEVSPLAKSLGFEVNRLSVAQRTNLKVFREESFDFDPSINRVETGTLLEGYFQSYKYFENVAPEIRTSLESLNVGSENFGTSLHVRRGDYLKSSNASFHGLISENFFKEALKQISITNPTSRYTLFTDSPEHVSEELAELISEYNISFFKQDISPLHLLAEMSQSQNFIMSNSSLSWWAAWLMPQNINSVVVAPTPWFVDKPNTPDLLLPHWKKIQNV